MPGTAHKSGCQKRKEREGSGGGFRPKYKSNNDQLLVSRPRKLLPVKLKHPMMAEEASVTAGTAKR